MGWGGGNPEPSPGEYDWGSLDVRVETMRRTGARMVITLCCAPDWMKGGEPGETDWSNLEGSSHLATLQSILAQFKFMHWIFFGDN